jgi:hypothetical protein
MTTMGLEVVQLHFKWYNDYQGHQTHVSKMINTCIPQVIEFTNLVQFQPKLVNNCKFWEE